MLNQNAVLEFRRICEQLGHPCTEREAVEMANRVIRYLRGANPSIREIAKLWFMIITLRIPASADSHNQKINITDMTKAVWSFSDLSSHIVILVFLRMR
jgi:hypothetical protein